MSDDQSLPRIESIDRALTLLDALAGHGSDGVALAALAEQTGMNKATAYRALSTLRGRGYAVQNPDGSYALGPAARALGAGQQGDEQLARELHPALTALSAATNELVHLGTLSGDRVVYLDKVEPDRAIRVWSAVGRSLPAASTSMGRALLAQGEFTTAQLRVFATSGVALGRLAEILDDARRHGFATEVEENEPGVACLGVAVLRDDQPVAALSVTMLASTFTSARRDEILRLLARVVPPLLPSGMRLGLRGPHTLG